MKPSFMIKTVFLLFTIFSIVLAQLDFLPLNADYTTFSGDTGKTYTEIYISFYQSDLTYHVEDTSNVAHFSHVLKIIQSDSVIYEITRNYQNKIAKGTKPGSGSQFMDVFAFELKPGKYEIIASLIDKVAQKNGEYALKAEIPIYNSELTMSDIELATKITKTDKISPFSAKNNLEILPNPARTYGITQPLLYFYFEVYNLKLNNDNKNRYNYHYYISNAEGGQVRDFPEKTKSTGSGVVAEAGGTNIITLASGSYHLNIEIEDLLTGNKASQRKEFKVYKPSRQASEAEIQARMEGYEEYVNFTEEQLDAEFRQVSYIATEQEDDVYSELDYEAKKRFLAGFWNRRDPDQTTQINEYKRNYFEILQFANANFSNAFKEGWRTDKGRVILIYGKPDEIERNPSTINTTPYEIWYYYSLEGGSQFVFGDITGHGDFELLHSTYRNEIKDPGWRERIGGSQSDFGGSSLDNY